MKLRVIALSLLCVACVAMAQKKDTRIHIFDTKVHSLKVAPVENMYLPPVVPLDGSERINVNFDYMDYDVHYLRYSVTHCNADWQPSALVESEYVEGFNYGDIEDYAECESTFMHYCNYNFTLPNDNFRLTKSGNYLLTVYEQSDPDKILFQTRFSLSEATVGVYAAVTSRTDVEYNGRYQQVSFDVTYTPGLVQDPYSELVAVVTQNSRDDNAVIVTKPMMVGNNKVTYDHNQSLIFPAGNEFRRFETVSLHSLNMGVEQIKYYEPLYHATLVTDVPRNNVQYLYDQTQYGRFTIRNSEGIDSYIDADYFMTHFSLATDGKLDGGSIFLYGEFAEGYPPESIRMRYDDASGCYVADVLLKQGAYNYMYLWYPDGSLQGQTGEIEGDHYETINEYLVRIYDRPSGERYDHLVGHAICYSGK